MFLRFCPVHCLLPFIKFTNFLSMMCTLDFVFLNANGLLIRQFDGWLLCSLLLRLTPLLVSIFACDGIASVVRVRVLGSISHEAGGGMDMGRFVHLYHRCRNSAVRAAKENWRIEYTYNVPEKIVEARGRQKQQEE